MNRRLAAIVRLYFKEDRPRLVKTVDHFAGRRSLREAIEKAALGLDEAGKRHSHQRRVARKALAAAARALLAVEAEIAKADTFDELHELVVWRTAGIRGFGPLARYDTALRIGAQLCLLPDFVYLHAGTRVGVRALGLDHRADRLPAGAFPAPLSKLNEHELEDLVCIYKNDLATGAPSGVQHASRARRPGCR